MSRLDSLKVGDVVYLACYAERRLATVSSINGNLVGLNTGEELWGGSGLGSVGKWRAYTSQSAMNSGEEEAARERLYSAGIYLDTHRLSASAVLEALREKGLVP